MIDKGFVTWKNDHYDILNIKEIKEFLNTLYKDDLDRRNQIHSLESTINSFGNGFGTRYHGNAKLLKYYKC